MITLISIILDIVNYRIFNSNSLFLSLFTIISLLYIKKDKNYYIKLFFLGILYDLIFTNYLVDPFIFLFLGFIISFLLKKIDKSIISYIFSGLLIIFIYQLVLYITLYLIGIKNNDFIFILKHYIIINIPYIYILSIIKRK